MQNFRNYYEILGVAKDATGEEIKKVFRRLARQYHPDLNPGNKAAEDQFKSINEAYEVLSDPEKRSQYDQFMRFWSGKKATKKPTTRTSNSNSSDFDPGQYSNFNDFVEQLLNTPSIKVASTPRPGPGGIRVDAADAFRPGRSTTAYVAPQRQIRKDIEARLTIPLEKAYTGGRERIRLEDGRSLEVDMPAGMVTGQRIRLRGQGTGGGDLYLKVTVQPHPFFTVEGADVACQIPVTPSEAVLGGQIEIPTLDGRVKMTVPAGVKSGQRLRLANKGYPSNNRRGDQLVEIEIVVPKNLTPQVRELYEKLQQVEDFKPRSHLPV